MMDHLIHYIIFMKQTLKKLWFLFFLSALGCAHSSEEPAQQTKIEKFQAMHPEERHIWNPPSEEELEARRERQKYLDVVAADLERLFLGFAGILGDEIILENLLRVKESELQQLEARLNQQREGEGKEKDLNRVLKELEGNVQEMDTRLTAIRKDRETRGVLPQAEPDDYRLAILLFRDGHHLRSIAAFERIMEKKHPEHLEDNILFGLASNYYKLKQYDTALRYLDTVIRDHPKTDKWLVSHAMTGLIHSRQGRSDKAIRVLESALQQQPNAELRKIIHRLLKVAKEGVSDASS